MVDIPEYKTTYEKYERYKKALDEIKMICRNTEAAGKSAEPNPCLRTLQSEIRYLAVSIMNDIINAGLANELGLDESTLTTGELIQEFLKFPLESPAVVTSLDAEEYSALFDVSFRADKGAVILETAEDITTSFIDDTETV
jgi:hypothetical protein